jgi:hypothetical protein
MVQMLINPSLYYNRLLNPHTHIYIHTYTHTFQVTASVATNVTGALPATAFYALQVCTPSVCPPSLCYAVCCKVLCFPPVLCVDSPPLTLTPLCKHIQLLLRTYIHTHTHTQTHTHTNTHTYIQVGQSGVTALIADSSSVTSVVSAPLTFDAAPSFDVDYPTESTLSYSWSCLESSPNFGTICNNYITTPTASEITLSANSVPVGSYRFTVLVSNTLGASDTATVLLTTTARVIPSISISTPLYKYNPQVPTLMCIKPTLSI